MPDDAREVIIKRSDIGKATNPEELIEDSTKDSEDTVHENELQAMANTTTLPGNHPQEDLLK